MSDYPETPPSEWDLAGWEGALTINVGTSYACKACGNLVMVTRGGVGVMELNCCGQPMQKVQASGGGAG
jgi:desulfoferrodoxin-like iron-binding protein